MTVSNSPSAGPKITGLVSMQIGGQAFGVPVLKVQDVIVQTTINVAPRAPSEVAGSLNLRGRIVTAIDMRRRLGLPPREPDQSFMCVIVERTGELFALLADDVGDVLWLPDSAFEATPVTLSATWRNLCDGLHRLDGQLLLSLNIDRVLSLDVNLASAA